MWNISNRANPRLRTGIPNHQGMQAQLMRAFLGSIETIDPDPAKIRNPQRLRNFVRVPKTRLLQTADLPQRLQAVVGNGLG